MSRADAVVGRLGGAVGAVVSRSVWMRRWYVPVTAAGLTALAVIAVFRMESTVSNYDPQYMRVLVERTRAQGGSYYSNGIHNKGPLEPLVYEVAGVIGGRDGWWLVLALFALVAATCVGLAAAVVAVRTGGSTLLGVCVAVAAIVHLTLTDADYAGVLYARNITTALVAVAVGVTLYGPAWSDERRRRRAVVAVGVAVGLAVQTLVTTVFTATPILLWAMWARRGQRVWGRPVWITMPSIAALAAVSAPLAYLTLGPWDDFVAGYWTHARFMSSGTGRGVGAQLELGWDQFLSYYGERPELIVLFGLWLVVAGVRFRAMAPTARGVHLVVAAWWLGAWIELVLSQRYSSHYFSVLAVPTIMVVATLVGDLAPVVKPIVRGRPAFALLPLVVAHVAIDVGGRSGFDVGIGTVAEVRSTGDLAARREVAIDGRTRTLRATLELVSEVGDPLLVWTSYPWPYLSLERTSATRYIWKTFLVGEIYLGESGPRYVLPGTWERFSADLDETDPTAYYVEAVNPIDPTTPFRGAVDARFTDVFDDGTATLGLRNDLAEWLSVPAPSSLPVPDVPDGPLVLSPDGCVRLDGRFDTTSRGPMVFSTIAEGGAPARVILAAGGEGVLVRTARDDRDDAVREIEVADRTTPFSLIVGARAMVLVVAGEVAGAVEIEPMAPATMTDGVAELRRAPAGLSAPPGFTGCPPEHASTRRTMDGE